MALIKIKEDVFDIVERVKEIDQGYYIVYNTKKSRYEIHNSKQVPSTFCIVCPNGLDGSVITKLRKTRIENLDKLLKEMDETNAKNEINQKNKLKDEVSWKAKEIFDYAKSKDENLNFSDIYTTKWS